MIVDDGASSDRAFLDLFEKLASTVKSCGDYVFQVGLVELLCRLFAASEFERRDFAERMWKQKAQHKENIAPMTCFEFTCIVMLQPDWYA